MSLLSDLPMRGLHPPLARYNWPPRSGARYREPETRGRNVRNLPVTFHKGDCRLHRKGQLVKAVPACDGPNNRLALQVNHAIPCLPVAVMISILTRVYLTVFLLVGKKALQPPVLARPCASDWADPMLSILLHTSGSLAHHWEGRVWGVQRHTELDADVTGPRSPIRIDPIIIRSNPPALPPFA